MNHEDDIEDAKPELVKVPTALRNVFHGHGLHIEDDGLVRWKTGSNGHPRTWHLGRKLYDTAVIITIEGLM